MLSLIQFLWKYLIKLGIYLDIFMPLFFLEKHM